MKTRAEALADRLEQGAQALVTLAERLSDAEWQRVVPNERRTIGVLIHHVATFYPFEIAAARALAAGKPIIEVTSASIDHANAQHAQYHAVVADQAPMPGLSLPHSPPSQPNCRSRHGKPMPSAKPQKFSSLPNWLPCGSAPRETASQARTAGLSCAGVTISSPMHPLTSLSRNSFMFPRCAGRLKLSLSRLNNCWASMNMKHALGLAGITTWRMSFSPLALLTLSQVVDLLKAVLPKPAFDAFVALERLRYVQARIACAKMSHYKMQKIKFTQSTVVTQ